MGWTSIGDYKSGDKVFVGLLVGVSTDDIVIAAAGRITQRVGDRCGVLNIEILKVSE